MRIVFGWICAALALLAAGAMSLNIAQGDAVSGIWCFVAGFLFAYIALQCWFSGGTQ